MSAERYKPSVATARVLAHSVEVGRPHSLGGVLATVEATFARSALAELNTHRAFSRNSASSRAIPVKKMLEMVETRPFIPRRFSLAQKGMHASEFVTPKDSGWEDCLQWWIDSRDLAIEQVEAGLKLGLHKQDVNRILEPFMEHTAIISSTEWSNFFNLRMAVDDQGNPLAYPPIYDLAVAIHDAVVYSTPQPIPNRQWHLPLTNFDGDWDLSLDERIKVSVARCARVSYLTHDGKRDIDADLNLFKRLYEAGHLSPFEHAAQADGLYGGSGNFTGWKQARWYVERGEAW